MKKYFMLSCALMCLTFIKAHAQSQNEANYEKFIGEPVVKFGAHFHHSNYIESYNTNAGGFILEASGPRMGVSYTGRIGATSSNQFYAYTGAGQVIGLYLLKDSKNTGLGVLGLIGMLIPESFILYSYPTSKSRLGFYLSPWGVEHIPDKETKVSIEAGVKYSRKLSDRFYIEPFIGAKAIYKTDRQAVSAGLNFFFTK
ncbi:hypothetical protein [Sporocytophaga myxococcoides]|nr:hypothetical protein [Sporocytophaga myxococcoides]